MGNIKDARAALLAACEGAGVRAYYGWGVFNAPCVRIFPADPWISPLGAGDARRVQRWEVWAVAGRVDSNATFEDVETLVENLTIALYGLNGWSLPTWSRPGNVNMGGVGYYAARGTLETRWEA